MKSAGAIVNSNAGFSFLRCGLKFRRDVQFMGRLDHNTEVMTKHLTQGFVNLRRERLAAESLTKLRLDHVKGRFDVGSLVIVL